MHFWGYVHLRAAYRSDQHQDLVTLRRIVLSSIAHEYGGAYIVPVVDEGVHKRWLEGLVDLGNHSNLTDDVLARRTSAQANGNRCRCHSRICSALLARPSISEVHM
jgi:hypothetical protein